MNKNVLMLGGILIDKYILVDKYPQKGGDVIIRDEFYKAGGCAVNAAKTLKNLGMNPVIYSVVTDDELGRLMRQYAASMGFDMRCITERKGLRTGYCMIVLDGDKERTFLTYKGCEGIFDAATIPKAVLDNTEYIFITGIYMIYNEYSAYICDFLEKMYAQGRRIIFDPGSLIKEIDRDALRRVLSVAYAVTPNTNEIDEIEQATGRDRFREKGFGYGISYIVETMGKDGCRLYTPSGARFYGAYKADVKDTAGSGDSFTAGLIYGLSSYGDIDAAVRYGSACGALTSEIMGAHGDFCVEDVKARMNFQNVDA